jgi:hypothetical protein
MPDAAPFSLQCVCAGVARSAPPSRSNRPPAVSPTGHTSPPRCWESRDRRWSRPLPRWGQRSFRRWKRFSRCKVSGGAPVIVSIACCCSTVISGQISRLHVSPTNVFHQASSPGGGKRRKLACSIGSPYSRQALGKSTAEAIFIFNSPSPKLAAQLGPGRKREIAIASLLCCTSPR